MNFHQIFLEIRKKVGNRADELYNKDLLKKIHGLTKDYHWDFDKETVKKSQQIVTVDNAKKEKDLGTKCFRNNQLQEAYTIYTKYLKLCHGIRDIDINDKNTMLYQGYANRSAVLFRAKKVRGPCPDSRL